MILRGMNDYSQRNYVLPEQKRLTEHYQTAALVNSFLNKVYLWMGVGLLSSALSCYWAVDSREFMSWLKSSFTNFLILAGAELLVVLGLTALLKYLSVSMARFGFLFYAVLSGLTLGPVVLAFTAESLTLAFVTTACTFGAMSIIGLTTKKDLSCWGRMLLMVLFGVIIASVVNILVGSSTMDLIISGAGVLLFSALTAYDTQKLKNIAVLEGLDTDKAAIYGALVLYLDFINLFLYLLRFLGKAKE